MAGGPVTCRGRSEGDRGSLGRPAPSMLRRSRTEWNPPTGQSPGSAAPAKCFGPWRTPRAALGGWDAGPSASEAAFGTRRNKGRPTLGGREKCNGRCVLIATVHLLGTSLLSPLAVPSPRWPGCRHTVGRGVGPGTRPSQLLTRLRLGGRWHLGGSTPPAVRVGLRDPRPTSANPDGRGREWNRPRRPGFRVGCANSTHGLSSPGRPRTRWARSEHNRGLSAKRIRAASTLSPAGRRSSLAHVVPARTRRRTRIASASRARQEAWPERRALI